MMIRGTAGPGAGLVLLAGLLAGCGSDGDDKDNGDAGDSSSFADQSYDDIKAAAIEAMGSLESVHVKADITSQEQNATLEVSMSADGSCTGTVAYGEVSAEVLQTESGAWFKPSPALLAEQFGDQAPAAIAFVGASWVADTQGEVTSSNCDLESFIEQVASDEEDESNTEVGEVEELGGEDVVPLTFTNESGDGSAYILAEGEHYITKFAVEGAAPGTVLFSEFDEPVDTEAPADDEIVDLADFEG